MYTFNTRCCVLGFFAYIYISWLEVVDFVYWIEEKWYGRDVVSIELYIGIIDQMYKQMRLKYK